jgi:peptidoglycan/xylan/chitin deacetylase (PgdA/CDA1 family)
MKILHIILIELSTKNNPVQNFTMKKIVLHFNLIFISLFILTGISNAQANYRPENAAREKRSFQWPEGKAMAISLTFDDARMTQVDKGIPLLDKYNVKGTFYVSLRSVEKRLDAWKAAARNGHDLGNHTLLHACSVNLGSGRGGLESYSLERMRTEIDSAGRTLSKLLGIQAVSFAYPCGQTFVGQGLDTRSYVPLIATMFESGRGWLDEAPNDPLNCDMAQLTGMKLDGMTFDQIKPLIESAKKQGKWLILAGHEMNESGTGLTSFLATIEEICKYASDPSNGIWIDNVHNISAYVKEKRAALQKIAEQNTPLK